MAKTIENGKQSPTLPTMAGTQGIKNRVDKINASIGQIDNPETLSKALTKISARLKAIRANIDKNPIKP